MEVEAEAAQSSLPKRSAPSGVQKGGKKARREDDDVKRGAAIPRPPPSTPTPMEGVEPEAGPSSREDPAPPIVPVPTPGEEKEEGRPAGAEEIDTRPNNGE